MKKCVFTGDWLGSKGVGVHRYAMQILLELDRRMDEEALGFEIEALTPEGYEGNPFKHIRIVRLGSARGKLGRILWQQLTFPRYVRKQRALGVDLTLAHPVRGCAIVAIHDCIYEAFAENFEDHRLHRQLYLWRVKQIAGNPKTRIVTVSNESKKEIQKYYGVSEDRISVIGNGWEHMKVIEADHSIFERFPQLQKGSYFFSLGSRYRHKNLRWVTDAARRHPEYLFVATGKEIHSGEQEGQKNVIYTGYLSDGEMKALMQNARALIQPSLYEGFGIPPLEALGVGTPVIVSHASCLPEIYGDSARYIDPHAPAVDLNRLLETPVGPAENALNRHSWRDSAERMAQLIRASLQGENR